MKGKLAAILLLLFLFGLPALVVSALLFTSVGPVTVRAGNQPGGRVSGTLVDQDESPLAGIGVRLRAVVRGADDVELETTSAADGSFELDLPPIDGHYELHAGGGTWQEESENISFLDRDGNPFDVGPIELVLKPACLIEVELVDSKGNPLGDGEFDLNGKFASGLLFGLHDSNLSSSGSFRGGRLELDGLPELDGVLTIELDSGETVQLMLELSPGVYRERIVL